MLFFLNETATTEISTLPLHDALPISRRSASPTASAAPPVLPARSGRLAKGNAPASTRNDTQATVQHSANHTSAADRKSTRLNSSHANISYAVFCLKKKKRTESPTYTL